MKFTKPLSSKLIWAGFFFLLFSSAILFSCNVTIKDEREKDAAAKNPCAELATIGTNFYELSLSKAQYEALRDFHAGAAKKMVVQFYFNSVSATPPSLIAYASKTKNDFDKTGTTLGKIMTITTTKGIAVPDEFVLGDQQVTFKAIKDNLITGSGIDPALNYELIFKPVMNGKNVAYKVCIKYMKAGETEPTEYCGGASPVPTQPSPPINAD